ncbi:hypothetical protein [Aureivirga marina]|uniref:hypothetical protein n=1 Tax=Aureivirga marina TaxID=1182451 RepID=UPI0018CBF0D6|nr:hypothetical protein [Aureivirga marina]
MKDELYDKLEFYYEQQKQYEGKKWVKSGLIFGGILFILNCIQNYTMGLFEFSFSFVFWKIIIWFLIGQAFGIIMKYYLRMSILRIKKKIRFS